MPLTKLGIAIENLFPVEQKKPWYEKAFIRALAFVKSIFKKSKPSGLIHHHPQKKLYTDEKSFITSSRIVAREKSNGYFFKTRFPFSSWEPEEKNSPPKREE